MADPEGSGGDPGRPPLPAAAEKEEAPACDVVFADTCIGGSMVASRLARARNGVRAFFLADYAVNPLGVKRGDAVRAALQGWVEFARPRFRHGRVGPDPLQASSSGSAGMRRCRLASPKSRRPAA